MIKDWTVDCKSFELQNYFLKLNLVWGKKFITQNKNQKFDPFKNNLMKEKMKEKEEGKYRKRTERETIKRN